MLLAIDIGNTNISLGVFKGRGLLRRVDLPTQEYGFSRLKRLIKKEKVKDAIICSVVPRVTRLLKGYLKKTLPGKSYCLGANIQAPVENLYRNPKQVGQDRLANAYAGIILYGVPIIIVDFGTAVTFDVISRNKKYLGGMILPGLDISLEALIERAALLPKIRLRKPREFIGRNTQESMLSGIVYGFSALTDDLTKRIKGEIGRDAKIIVTGGKGCLVAQYCRQIDRIDQDLTLKGLNLIYRDIVLNSMSKPR
ncbi:MAG: type III pantothenate kinase [Candidatus Omnitrophota bacterium]